MRGCYVTVDDQNRYLFVAGYYDGRVTMMHLNEDGSVGEVACGIYHEALGLSVADKNFMPHVTCVEMTPDQKYLCAVDSGLDHVKVYEIDYEKGLLGHSDADVLIHAVCDALLGAAALGDIGKHFPDSDAAYKNIESTILLKNVAAFLKDKGYSISNIDVTVIAQAPKLATYIDTMRKKVADCCGIDVDRMSIKATTEEGLGFTGQKLGIAVHSVCIIE